MNNKFTIDNKLAQQKCLDEVITRIQEIDDPLSVGVIAAQDVIDIVLDNLGLEIYNNAINDANKLIEGKTEDLRYEIEELKK